MQRGFSVKVPAVFMRGGTSRGLFFHERDLPEDPTRRDRFILAAYGSPDPDRRQVDGVGGATSSTSKVAVISDGRHLRVDVLYHFGQVWIDKALIDRRGNCGNISSAVGPFAVDEGLVEATDPVTTVRFLNVNTNKTIVAHVPTRDGRFDPVGDFVLPGVPGGGAAIQLDFVEPGGCRSPDTCCPPATPATSWRFPESDRDRGEHRRRGQPAGLRALGGPRSARRRGTRPTRSTRVPTCWSASSASGPRPAWSRGSWRRPRRRP